MHIYIYTYICMCVYIYTHNYIYVYIHTHIFTNIHIYINEYIHNYKYREGIETLGPCFIFPTDQSLTPQSKPSASMSCAIRLDREGLQVFIYFSCGRCIDDFVPFLLMPFLAGL
jgi:hypothetical protein